MITREGFLELDGRRTWYRTYGEPRLPAGAAAAQVAMSGGYESVRPEHAEEMLARLHDAQWELFEDAAHAAVFELPERYTQVLSEFLTTIDARRPAAPGS